MEPVEEIETIELETGPMWTSFLNFKFQWTETQDGVVKDLRGDYVTKCLINGKPYYCGSPRRFTKESFDRKLKEITNPKTTAVAGKGV